jgi:hypothetical protein
MWRHLAAEVGTFEIMGGQESHNKPIGYGASGAYAPGPDEEEEEAFGVLTVPVQWQEVHKNNTVLIREDCSHVLFFNWCNLEFLLSQPCHVASFH